MVVIGLTGGIGTGKTEVARILRGLGAAVIDADQIAHQAYSRDSDGWAEIARTFGPDVLCASGDVDRSRLARVVFHDKEALDQLNSIVHPRVRASVEARLEMLKEAGTVVVVVEAALLVEAGWSDIVDQIWVTTATSSQVMQRVMRRDDLDSGEVETRIKAQRQQSERFAHADVIVHNRCTVQELKRTVEEKWLSLTKGM